MARVPRTMVTRSMFRQAVSVMRSRLLQLLQKRREAAINIQKIYRGFSIRKRLAICSICWLAVTVGLMQINPCKHTFHAKCLNDWLITRNNCPNCRGIAEEEGAEEAPADQEPAEEEGAEEAPAEQAPAEEEGAGGLHGINLYSSDEESEASEEESEEENTGPVCAAGCEECMGVSRYFTCNHYQCIGCVLRQHQCVSCENEFFIPQATLLLLGINYAIKRYQRDIGH